MLNLAQEIDKIVTKLVQNNQKINTILEPVSDLIYNAILSNFSSNGRWDGQGTDLFSGGSYQWRPLSSSTLKNYKRKGYDLRPTLNRSSGLIDSIDVRPQGKSIIISANKEYAAIHNYGGTIEIQGGESEAKWKATKSKNGYTFKFAKKKAKGKNIISRKFQRKARQIRIPARPFLTLTPQDVEEIINTYVKLFIGIL